MGGAGWGWSLLVPQTLEPVMGGKEGLEVAGDMQKRIDPLWLID